MTRPRLPWPPPMPRAGVFVLGPIRQDPTGVSYRAWAPGEPGEVALWVDAARIDDDPIRAERLARQAIALERLRHPNLAEVVRLADLDGRIALVERLDGATLGDGDREDDARPGPSAVRKAVGTALQAAWGLLALHEAGLVHGDLRPESLVERPDGRVVLAGLGRVAPPPEDPEAIGPRAVPDPSAVRDDLERFGRLLYRLVTGTPAGLPADTPTAEAINPRVPAALSDLIRRLMLPPSEGGYAGASAVVADLERLAGAPGPKGFLPRAELVEAYREAASDFADTPTSRLRQTVLLASYVGTAALALLALPVGLTSLAIGLVGLMAMTAGFSFVISGVRRGGPLFDRARRFVAGGRGRDLATVAAVLVLAVAGLAASGTLGVAIALAVVAAILAGAQEVLIDQKVAEERREPSDRAAAILRDLRRSGLAEPGVLAFAVDHGGDHWGPLFLALFGFDAYRDARSRREVPPAERLVRFGLMGRVVAGLDARLRARRDERDCPLLMDLHERRLRAMGVFELTARRRSWRIAPAVIARARAYDPGATPPERPIASALAEAVWDPEATLGDLDAAPEPIAARVRRLSGAMLDALTGPRARLLAGLALLVGFLAWAHQNGLIRGEDVSELVREARSAEGLDDLGEVIGPRRDRLLEAAEAARPLRVEGAPMRVPAVFGGFGAGLAASILLVSSAFRGRWAGLGVIAAALVVLLGADLGLSAGLGMGVGLPGTPWRRANPAPHRRRARRRPARNRA